MRLLILLLFPYVLVAQVLPAGATPAAGLPQGTTADITAVTGALEGFMAFSTDEQIIYYFDGTNWVPFDNQFDDEVPLRVNVDVDDGGKTIADGFVEETTVKEVIDAIAPITSAAARVFYPPSIEVPIPSIGGPFNLDLYAQYTAQFSSPTASSSGAPAIPVYANATDLYYYVTFADPTVFDTAPGREITIDANGMMTYYIVALPTDFNTLINVVFVVK